MCGIFGWVSQEAIEPETARRALRTLTHRGPDDEGIYENLHGSLFLGHRRLSIIDLSAAGRQPMGNGSCPRCRERGAVSWLVYNGEIYNFQELREELLSKGHRFQSRADTEVILHLYAQEGEGFIRRLNGMFAFALYDPSAQRLLLARDRLGIKPLYYAQAKGFFLFASEIKAILASGVLPSEVDWQAISDYFTFLFVPHPQTAFKAIRQLPPATLLLYDLRAKAATLRRYWAPWENNPFDRAISSRAELKARVRELLIDAVRKQLVSDVPLGIFFSGGVDSTLLAAIAARHLGVRTKTFTVGFHHPGSRVQDDLPYAAAASKALGTDHRELLVDVAGWEEILRMVAFFDQPFANPTFYLQYEIARKTKEHVGVALSGVGGDELFGGYPKYRLFPWAAVLRTFPAGAGQGIGRLLSPLREERWGPLLRRTRRLFKGAGQPLSEQYVRWSYYLTEGEKEGLFRKSSGSDGRRSLPASRHLEEAFLGMPKGTDIYGKLFYAELQTFLAGNLLEYTDKMTMAVALETRVPFLDHRLVELGAMIPFSEKVGWRRSKMILLEAFDDLLPRDVVRAPKRGFSPPIAVWMEKVLDGYFGRVLTRERVRKEGIFDWEGIDRMRKIQRSGRRDLSMELLGILMFDVWFRKYILREELFPEAAS